MPFARVVLLFPVLLLFVGVVLAGLTVGIVPVRACLLFAANEDYNDCVTRCWGSNVRYKPFPKERFSDTYSGYKDYAGWEYYKDDKQQQGTSYCVEHGVVVGIRFAFSVLATPNGSLAWSLWCLKGLLVAICTALDQSGRTYTVAGSGFEGYVDGDIAMARFNRPHGLAVDYDGYIYVADTHNHVIRKIDPHKGLVSTVAGDGVAGYVRACSVVPALTRQIQGSLRLTAGVVVVKFRAVVTSVL